MAQINLLKQKSPSENLAGVLPKIIANVLVAAVLGLGVYYGWLWYRISQTEHAISSGQQALAKAAESVKDISGREEVYTRQAQLKQYNTLVAGHLYWSHLFPALAAATLKGSSYSSMRVTSEGTLQLSVTLSDLNAVDKYIQVFDQPQFNKYFSNLVVNGLKRTGIGPDSPYDLEARLTFDKSLLNYSWSGLGN
ncbi:MAG: hypothetical protein KGJ93_02440 [Patescibacteria group bacterium]|nr:hypothetical protein [Patescibacteria group bacterium]